MAAPEQKMDWSRIPYGWYTKVPHLKAVSKELPIPREIDPNELVATDPPVKFDIVPMTHQERLEYLADNWERLKDGRT